MGFPLRDSSQGVRRKGYVEHRTEIQDLIRPSTRAKLEAMLPKKKRK